MISPPQIDVRRCDTDIVLRLYCTSPLVHGAFGEKAGNATLFRRHGVVSLPGHPRVPVVSGNALRGVMRRFLMRELFECTGLSRTSLPGPAWDRLYAAIANGGHLDGSETRVDPDEIRALRDALPVLSVLGAALYSWMLPGHVKVGFLWPRCIETVSGWQVDPEGPEAPLHAEDLIEEISLCRHIDREHQDPQVSGVTPMPTTVEALSAGTVLESRIMFERHATDLEMSALAHAAIGVITLGGKSGSGFGRVEIVRGSQLGDGGALYRAWLDSTADLGARLQSLAATLAPQVKKAKGKAKTEAEAPL